MVTNSSKRWNLSGFCLQFLCFCASEWPRTWLESVSNLKKFHAEHFGMLYLPPGGSGRSQWWKNHQKSLKWQKMSGFFFAIFCFCASEWPRTWLESVSNLIKFYAEHFGMLYLPPGGSGRSQWWKNHPKISEMAKKHPLFDGFLLPDRLLDLGYGLMGHGCDRWSNSYHTHSSGGGRGHIEASSAWWVSHPVFTRGFYYITH